MFLRIPGFDGFEVVLFIIEWLQYIVAANVIAVALARKGAGRMLVVCLIPLAVVGLIGAVTFGSREAAKERGFSLDKPSVRQAVEIYIEKGEGPNGENLEEILEQDKFAPTFGMEELSYLGRDLLWHTLLHLDAHNAENIPVAYNKGNDWFRATLGEPMIYTSGIYRNGNESLKEAQEYKLDYVAQAIDLKAEDNVLDIGCGWGRLLNHFATKYGAKVTGISLSEEQVKFGRELNKDVSDKVNILLHDFMTVDLKPKSFKKITSLEMAEHVGIKRYTSFLRKVHSLLADDGTLYFQVAGLRREWQYEDLCWGMFMGEHVFPGADASCNMGWVTQQLERAGFEVQRVSNLGSHYSRTLAQWLEEWQAHKSEMVEKYGLRSFRRWEVFLRWSVRVARQGSSTVFMITATKHGQEPARLDAQRRLAPQL